MTTPFRPSNGTEGAAFDDDWCSSCQRDRAFRESRMEDGALGCPILAAALFHQSDDPEYPKEWILDNSGSPRCTAFEQYNDLPPRCPNTRDMFEESR